VDITSEAQDFEPHDAARHINIIRHLEGSTMKFRQLITKLFRRGSALAPLLTLLLATGAATVPTDAQAAPARYATTSKSATRVKPSPSRSRYSSRVTSRKAGENRAKRTNRSSAGRSALGDGRRNGVRLSSSPVSPQSAGTRDTRRDAVQLSGTPATSWRAWNRATAPSSRSQNGASQSLRAGSRMQVRFRPATRGG
jgi:hypothetical protein